MNEQAIEHTVIRGNKAFTVWQGPYGYSLVYYRPINAKTGQPWQARRSVGPGTFEGDNHKVLAMACWLKAVTEAQKGAR